MLKGLKVFVYNMLQKKIYCRQPFKETKQTLFFFTNSNLLITDQQILDIYFFFF